jgi:hypothetical protein
MYLNWSAVDWLVGSKSWSLFYQITTGILLGLTGVLGCCILGFRQHTERSYLSLRNSPKIRVFFMYILPLIIFIYFFTFAMLTLLDTDEATSYIRAYSDDFFGRAELAVGKEVNGLLDKDEFAKFWYLLPQYRDLEDNEAFTQRTTHLFDTLREGDYVTPDGMFRGFLMSLSAVRMAFGVSSLFACLISLALSLYYWFWYRHLSESRFEERLRVLKTQAGIYAMSQDDIEAAPLNSEQNFDFFSGYEEDFEDDLPPMR